MANPQEVVGKVDKNVLRIPLSAIKVDNDWNARSGGWQSQAEASEGELKEGENGELGLAGLIQSIAASGQDTAVHVRANRSGKQPYELVTGFRRMEALLRLAKKGIKIPGWDDIANPTVLAIVKTVTELEARALNTRENTERDNLSTADVAWSIAQLKAEHIKHGGKDAKELTSTAISQAIGKSIGYVAKLDRIMTETHPAILASWREMPVNADPLSVEKRLELIKTPKNEQQKVYAELLSTAPKKTNEWMPKAETMAKRIGFLLGSLEYAKKIHTHDLDFGVDIKLLTAANFLVVRGKAEEGATEKQWAALAAAAEEGWEEAMNPQPLEETPAPEKSGVNAKTVPEAPASNSGAKAAATA